MSSSNKVVFIARDILRKLHSAFEYFDLSDFQGHNILVKLHMGEKGNKWYVDPLIVRKVCEELNLLSTDPFLYDTIVRYDGSRNTKEKYFETAKQNGFSELGYPIIIGNKGTRVTQDGHDFEVAKEVYNSKYMVAISHVKGHILSGAGGAIKNFGMGGLSVKSKHYIHDGGQPIIKTEKCRLCKKCESICQSIDRNCITVDDRWEINYDRCFGCGRCIRNCDYEALTYRRDDFNHLLALGAKACVQNKRVLYVNIALKITKYCDCKAEALPIICPDVGVFLSEDPVAIDTASINLIEERMGRTFKQEWGIDAMEHIKYAEKDGLGNTKYELFRI